MSAGAAFARLLGLLAAMALIALVIGRVIDEPIERYGDSAAGWIEHQARLLAELRLREAEGGPIAALRAADGLYPPGLHLLAIALSTVGGRSPAVAGLIGPAALLLMAGSVGAVSRSFGAKTASATLFCLFTPALHGMAARYYYDLPMAALLWAAAAACLRSRGRPWMTAAAATLAMGAAFFKWSALPLGLPLLLVAARRSRAWSAGLAPIALVAALPLALALGLGSPGAMGAVSFQPPTGTTPHPAWAALPGVGEALGAMLAQAAAVDGERLRFYPSRIIDSVYGPLGALVIGAAALRARGIGGALLLPSAATAAFLLLLLPPLDERFLVVWLGLPALAAGLGAERWARSLRAGAPAAAALALAVGLTVALDLHAPGRHAEDPAIQSAPEAQGRAPHPGWGPGSSVDRRGWSRTAHRPPTREALGGLILEDITQNNVQRVIAADQLRLLEGERNWWGAQELGRALDGAPLQATLHTEGPLPPPIPGARLYLPPDDSPLRRPDHRPAEAGWLRCPEPLLRDPAGGPGIERWCAPQGAP